MVRLHMEGAGNAPAPSVVQSSLLHVSRFHQSPIDELGGGPAKYAGATLGSGRPAREGSPWGGEVRALVALLSSLGRWLGQSGLPWMPSERCGGLPSEALYVSGPAGP